MSLLSRSPRRSRLTHQLLAILVVIAGSSAIGSTGVTAGLIEPLEWDGRGQDCVGAFDGAMVITTILAPNLGDGVDDPWANPIPANGTVFGGAAPVVNLTVPNGFFDAERLDADGGAISGFYLVGFEFVDDCDTRNPIPFTPCFTTSGEPDPSILDLGDQFLLFFFFGDVIGDQSTTISISETCTPEVPDGGSGNLDLGDFLDLIDDINLDFEFDVALRPDIDIDIDHYRRMAEAQETALPDTL